MMRARYHSLSRSRKGFTLLETLATSCLSLVVMTSLVSLHYLTALTGKDVLGDIRSRQLCQSALDQVRTRIMNARIGSCVVTDEGHRIEFLDPNGSGVTSAFEFANGRLTLDLVLGDDLEAYHLVEGLLDVSFECLNSGSAVRVEASAQMAKGKGETMTSKGEALIHLRNP